MRGRPASLTGLRAVVDGSAAPSMPAYVVTTDNYLLTYLHRGLSQT